MNIRTSRTLPPSCMYCLGELSRMVGTPANMLFPSERDSARSSNKPPPRARFLQTETPGSGSGSGPMGRPRASTGRAPSPPSAHQVGPGGAGPRARLELHLRNPDMTKDTDASVPPDSDQSPEHAWNPVLDLALLLTSWVPVKKHFHSDPHSLPPETRVRRGACAPVCPRALGGGGAALPTSTGIQAAAL